MVQVPDVVRNKAHVYGASSWLDSVDELVEHLEREWSIGTGQTFGDSSEAIVMEAVTFDGTPAVLKLVMPRTVEVASHEITVLELAQGVGCAHLYRSDAGLGALLLERLGPALSALSLPIRQRHEILCSTVEQLWRPANECGLPTGAEKGTWLVDFITTTWEELDHPCDVRAIDDAVACAQRRIAAHDEERARLVHGDVHQWNALRSAGGFKLVDPDGLLAEPEYDLGILMREDSLELLATDPFERARWLAQRCHLDAQAIWEWGVVERVSTGLLCTQIQLQPVGREMLAAADALATLSAW